MKYLKLFFPLMVVLSTISVKAVASVYDLQGLLIDRGEVEYRNISFDQHSNSNSAVLTVTKKERAYGESNDVDSLDSLVITFPELEKLVVKNFRKLDDRRFRAVVANFWIYKEVIVEVRVSEWYTDANVDIEVYVSEKGVFVNPENGSKGLRILNAHGSLRDVTPTRVADIEKTILEGKSISLSLRDRVSVFDRYNAGFVVNTSWLGHGNKDIIVGKNDFPLSEADFIAPIAIVIENAGQDGPLVKVKYRRENDAPFEYTYPQRLLDLLKAECSGGDCQASMPE
ncbi:MAG TPA: hypothetical protein VN030_09160 [Cellvibrio sp.]|nr:hypothetical protein [Cellvibrio sp.]